MVSALKQAMVSVDEMKNSLSFYRDLMGLEILSEANVRSPSLERLWRLPEGTTAHMIVLGKRDVAKGQIRLVQFSPKSKTVIRSAARNWDLGIFDIGFLGQNADKTYELFRGNGIPSTPIAAYEIPDYKDMKVKEIMIQAPDGVKTVFLHYDPPYQPRGLVGYSEVLHSAIIVSDMEKSLDFYVGVLEMEPQTDMLVDNDALLHTLLGFPEDSPISMARIISLRREKGFTGRVMLFQFLDERKNPVTGVDYSSEATPPNIGLCLLAFDAIDIYELESRLKRHGIEMICPPVKVDRDLIDGRTAMTVRSPEGTLLEFSQDKQ